MIQFLMQCDLINFFFFCRTSGLMRLQENKQGSKQTKTNIEKPATVVDQLFRLKRDIGLVQRGCIDTHGMIRPCCWFWLAA